jgi:hypothetical protein
MTSRSTFFGPERHKVSASKQFYAGILRLTTFVLS